MIRLAAVIFCLSALVSGYAAWVFRRERRKRDPWISMVPGYLGVAINYWFYLRKAYDFGDFLLSVFMFAGTIGLFEQMRKIYKSECSLIGSESASGLDEHEKNQ